MRLAIVLLVASATLMQQAGCTTAAGQSVPQREWYFRSAIDHTTYVMDERVSPPICYAFPDTTGVGFLAIPVDCALVRHVITAHIRNPANVRGPSIGPDDGTGIDRQGL